MKKVYLFLIAFVFGTGIAFAQTPTFQLVTWTATNVPITNNQIFDLVTAPLTTSESKFKLRNITATTQTLTIKRNDNLINTVSSFDMASPYFCAGSVCYNSTITISSETIAANSEVNFMADLLEATAVGLSNISYDIMNGSEQLTVVFKYNYTLGIKANSNDLAEISIYPNPTSGLVTLSGVEGCDVTICNILGVKIISTQITNDRFNIDLSKEGNGVYLLEIKKGSEVYHKRVVKE